MNALASVVRLDDVRRRERRNGAHRTRDLRFLWQRWAARRRHRADLRRLLGIGGYLISDIGQEHGRAIEEAGKPFWRA